MIRESFILWFDRRSVISLIIYLGKSIEKCSFRDPELVKQHPTIINTLNTYLVPTITYINSRENFMSKGISHLNKKRMWSSALTWGKNQLSEDNRHFGSLGKIPNPKLPWGWSRGMNDEAFWADVIMGCSFDSLNIRSMSQFSQSKAAKILTFDSSHEILMMDLSSTIFDHLAIEPEMDHDFSESCEIKLIDSWGAVGKQIDVLGNFVRSCDA